MCLSATVIDSVLKSGKYYTPQTFLELWKYRIIHQRWYVERSSDGDSEEKDFEQNSE